MSTTKQILVNRIHEGDIVLDQNSQDATFKIIEKTYDELKEDEILVKVIYFSNEPAQRGWVSPDKANYLPELHVGDVMRSLGLGRVIESKSSKYSVGDYAYGLFGWTEIAKAKDGDMFLYKIESDLPLTTFVSVMGLTGLTAYFGFFRVGKPNKDQVILVSGAAGAVGSVVIQLAKNVVGAKKVIGIAGGEDKCNYVKSLGADKCVDYKSLTFAADLEAALEGDTIDLYFENIGGKIMDAAFTNMTVGATTVFCGCISNYNDPTNGVHNMFFITSHRLVIKGYIVTDYMSEFPTAFNDLTTYINEGKIKLDHSYTLKNITGSFEKVPETWVGLFKGVNTGKLITQISDVKN